MINREHESSTRLPELARFNEARGIKPGESLDLALARTRQPIVLFSSVENILAACGYRTITGKDQRDFSIIPVENPIQEASRVREPGIIPLVIHDATDPVLFQRMFADGPRFGQLLMGHMYSSPELGHESPSVHVVGVANQGLEIISGLKVQLDELTEREMALRRREILGADVVSNEDFRVIL